MNYGKTALMKAAEKGLVDFAEILIQEGAKLDVPDSDGKHALRLALKDESKRCIDILAVCRAI